MTTRASNAPSITVHGVAGVQVLRPAPSSAIGFGDVTADADGFKIDVRLVAVIPLVAHDESIASTGTQGNVKAIEAAVRGKLAEWRALLTRQTQDGRELLRQVLNGPIRFTPDGKMYRFHGKAALERLLSGTASNLCGVPGRI